MIRIIENFSEQPNLSNREDIKRKLGELQQKVLSLKDEIKRREEVDKKLSNLKKEEEEIITIIKGLEEKIKELEISINKKPETDEEEDMWIEINLRILKIRETIIKLYDNLEINDLSIEEVLKELEIIDIETEDNLL